jgi:uncharacterized protein (DUF1697 family)
MTRFVVLLRGVNVGKGHRVPMAEFHLLLEALGHRAVKTLLNSGNAVFTPSGGAVTARLHQDIAAAVQTRCGVTTPVIVKSTAQWAAIVRANPMVPPLAEHSRFLVALAQEAATLEALAALQPLVSATEQFTVTADAAYLHCPAGLLQSKVGAALVGRLGKGVTTRNWATVLKLEALLNAAA